MTSHRRFRREFIKLTGVGIAGVVSGPWLGMAEAAEAQDAELVVFNAKVYTVDPRVSKAEAFAVKARPVHRRGDHRGDEGAHRQGDANVRRQTDDHRARVHRLPQSYAG